MSQTADHIREAQLQHQRLKEIAKLRKRLYDLENMDEYGLVNKNIDDQTSGEELSPYHEQKSPPHVIDKFGHSSPSSLSHGTDLSDEIVSNELSLSVKPSSNNGVLTNSQKTRMNVMESSSDMVWDGEIAGYPKSTSVSRFDYKSLHSATRVVQSTSSHGVIQIMTVHGNHNEFSDTQSRLASRARVQMHSQVDDIDTLGLGVFDYMNDTDEYKPQIPAHPAAVVDKTIAVNVATTYHVNDSPSATTSATNYSSSSNSNSRSSGISLANSILGDVVAEPSGTITIATTETASNHCGEDSCGYKPGEPLDSFDFSADIFDDPLQSFGDNAYADPNSVLSDFVAAKGLVSGEWMDSSTAACGTATGGRDSTGKEVMHAPKCNGRATVAGKQKGTKRGRTSAQAKKKSTSATKTSAKGSSKPHKKPRIVSDDDEGGDDATVRSDHCSDDEDDSEDRGHCGARQNSSKLPPKVFDFSLCDMATVNLWALNAQIRWMTKHIDSVAFPAIYDEYHGILRSKYSSEADQKEAVMYMAKLASVDYPPVDTFVESNLADTLQRMVSNTAGRGCDQDPSHSTLLTITLEALYLLLNLAEIGDRVVQCIMGANLLPRLVEIVADASNHSAQCQALNVLNICAYTESKWVVESGVVDAVINGYQAENNKQFLFYPAKLLHTLSKSVNVSQLAPSRRVLSGILHFITAMLVTADYNMTFYAVELVGNLLTKNAVKCDTMTQSSGDSSSGDNTTCATNDGRSSDTVVEANSQRSAMLAYTVRNIVTEGIDSTLVQVLGAKNQSQKVQTAICVTLVALTSAMTAAQVKVLVDSAQSLLPLLLSLLMPLKQSNMAQSRSAEACKCLSLLMVVCPTQVVTAMRWGNQRSDRVVRLLEDYQYYAKNSMLRECAQMVLVAVEKVLSSGM